MKWLVITVLTDHDLGYQAGFGQTFRDKVRRYLTADHSLTAGAAVLRAHILIHHEAGRDVFQFLADLIADEAQFTLAAGTVFR